MSVESIMDEARRRHGFRTIAEVARLAESNTIFDVYSTLVATTAMIGRDNVLHPGVIVRADGGDCVLGSGVVLHAGTSIEAVAGGSVVVGDGCVLGPGGVQIRANRGNARIRLGDRVRLLNGVELLGICDIGDGAQILGAIVAQNVTLAGGGDYTAADPDERGAVLKGSGLARGLVLGIGDVVNAVGDFAAAPVERQSKYHPRPA